MRHRFDGKIFHAQKGFSIIEFMIAMTIGLVVLMVAVQIVVSSRRALDTVHGQLLAQQAGRFGLYFISQSTRLTGYVDAGELTPSEGDFYASELVNRLAIDEQWNGNSMFQAKAVIAGGDSADESLYQAKPNNDSFSVRLQGSNTINLLDCSGVAIGAADVSVMTFYVDTDNQLRCAVTDSNGARNVALVEGVYAMQLLYAVTHSNQQQHTYGYLNASQMGLDDWQNVKGVKVGLLAGSDNNLSNASPESLPLLDVTIDSADLDDGHIYQSYIQTIALRNHISNQ
tara:strand:- start:43 stop:897 length:855 start_codon:yes stop_codon:yes gene_type:complete